MKKQIIMLCVLLALIMVPVEPGQETVMAPGQAQAVVSEVRPVQVSVRAT